tara:strand:+ start:312 stop:473 length:162 start_codon:yes stop_codon:yes gene_type:complete
MTHSITINPSSKTIEVIKEMIYRKDEHRKIIINKMKEEEEFTGNCKDSDLGGF